MSYQTLQRAVTARLEIKKSEFITYAYPATTREQAMFHVEQLRVKHPDARHWCWAYIIGDPENTTSAGFDDDGEQYITDGEISVIENGQFTGLDEEFEKRKNQSVFKTLDDKLLITYPATSAERAVIYVADDVNCPYCRRLHQQLPTLNAKGVTVKVIGYPIYEQSPAQMRGIWCQADDNSRRKAFDRAMLAGEMTPAPASCSADYVTPNREKAAGLAVMATPAIYREDGVLYQASFESPEFLEFLGVR